MKLSKRALLLENIQPTATKLFEQAEFNVELHTGSLSDHDLETSLQKASLLGIRSKTTLTKNIFDSAPHLEAIGAYCIGTNQIDLDAARTHGIPVFNAPYSNTRSVVELTLASIIMLLRKSFDTSGAMHQGVWNKSAKGCFEVRGKKLGIVGYGNIGSQLSVLAEALGMHVCYYDIAERLGMGNAKKCTTLAELLKTSDIVTLHIDGRKENKDFFGAKELNAMKKGSYLLNISRGFVVDVDALAQQIKQGRIAGCAIDVYPEEPRANTDDFQTPLQGLPNVILSPHTGGSTQEAQKNIAEFVTNKLLTYLETGDTSMSVNFPNLSVPSEFSGCRFMHVHENVPGVLADIDNMLANHDINITGQYLKTNDTIGYVVVDTNAKKSICNKLEKELASINHTIKVTSRFGT